MVFLSDMVLLKMDIGKLQIVGKRTMKILNDYMELSYRMEIVEDKDEGGFVVSYPDLPGCITCGETRESAVVNALDAKKAWLEAYFQNNDCEGISTQL